MFRTSKFFYGDLSLYLYNKRVTVTPSSDRIIEPNWTDITNTKPLFFIACHDYPKHNSKLCIGVNKSFVSSLITPCRLWSCDYLHVIITVAPAAGGNFVGICGALYTKTTLLGCIQERVADAKYHTKSSKISASGEPSWRLNKSYFAFFWKSWPGDLSGLAT